MLSLKGKFEATKKLQAVETIPLPALQKHGTFHRSSAVVAMEAPLPIIAEYYIYIYIYNIY